MDHRTWQSWLWLDSPNSCQAPWQTLYLQMFSPQNWPNMICADPPDKLNEKLLSLRLPAKYFHTKLKERTWNFDEDPVTSEEKLDIIVELWNIRNEMESVAGEDHIKVVVSQRWEIRGINVSHCNKIFCGICRKKMKNIFWITYLKYLLRFYLLFSFGKVQHFSENCQLSPHS